MADSVSIRQNTETPRRGDNRTIKIVDWLVSGNCQHDNKPEEAGKGNSTRCSIDKIFAVPVER